VTPGAPPAPGPGAPDGADDPNGAGPPARPPAASPRLPFAALLGFAVTGVVIVIAVVLFERGAPLGPSGVTTTAPTAQTSRATTRPVTPTPARATATLANATTSPPAPGAPVTWQARSSSDLRPASAAGPRPTPTTTSTWPPGWFGICAPNSSFKQHVVQHGMQPPC
jgi:hypothetical protein